jgi:anthranilate synthase component 1
MALGFCLKSHLIALESVEGGEKWGRYSMIGLHAKTVIKVFDYDVHIEYQGELLESNKVIKEQLLRQDK